MGTSTDPGSGGRGAERRRYQRLPTSFKPSQTRRLGDAGWEPVEATILNISAGGLLISTEQPLRVGDYVELQFDLPGGGASLSVRLDVLRVGPLEAGGMSVWRAGCQFQQSNPQYRELIAPRWRRTSRECGAAAGLQQKWACKSAGWATRSRSAAGTGTRERPCRSSAQRDPLQSAPPPLCTGGSLAEALRSAGPPDGGRLAHPGRKLLSSNRLHFADSYPSTPRSRSAPTVETGGR